MRKNHPDRVAELDPEFQTLAEDKSKRLNNARAEGLRRFEN
jgi:DnaJ-domain-containing protein 1